MSRSPRIVAVAGAPHVTNRQNLLCAMQILEAASIIGLIRRTQALAGRVGVVAGVLGLFRREAVLAVGGYRARWRPRISTCRGDCCLRVGTPRTSPTRSSAWKCRPGCAPCGRSAAAGRADRARCCTSTSEDAALASPAAVAAGAGGPRVAAWVVGFAAGRAGRDQRANRAARVPPSSIVLSWGIAAGGGGNPAARVRAAARLPVRPPGGARVPARAALPTGLLDGLAPRPCAPSSSVAPGSVAEAASSGTSLASGLDLASGCQGLFLVSHSCSSPPVISRVS